MWPMLLGEAGVYLLHRLAIFELELHGSIGAKPLGRCRCKGEGRHGSYQFSPCLPSPMIVCVSLTARFGYRRRRAGVLPIFTPARQYFGCRSEDFQVDNIKLKTVKRFTAIPWVAS